MQKPLSLWRRKRSSTLQARKVRRRPPRPAPITTGPATANAPSTSFSNYRCEVKRFLGKGGKKGVYLAQDTLPDREVAFALIKAEGLDQVCRTRITHKGQAMGPLGSHPPHRSRVRSCSRCGPHLFGNRANSGDDVEGVIEDAVDHRLSLEQALDIAKEIGRGWSSHPAGASCTGT